MDLLWRYGLNVRQQRHLPVDGDPLRPVHDIFPPANLRAFFGFAAGGWHVLYDPRLTLWELASLHAALSADLRTVVVVAVARSSSSSLGYGWWEAGRRVRWTFRQGAAAAESVGDEEPWERTPSVTPEDISVRLQRRWGIDLQEARAVDVLYVSEEVERARRGLLRRFW